MVSRRKSLSGLLKKENLSLFLSRWLLPTPTSQSKTGLNFATRWSLLIGRPTTFSARLCWRAANGTSQDLRTGGHLRGGGRKPCGQSNETRKKDFASASLRPGGVGTTKVHSCSGGLQTHRQSCVQARLANC